MQDDLKIEIESLESRTGANSDSPNPPAPCDTTSPNTCFQAPVSHDVFKFIHEFTLTLKITKLQMLQSLLNNVDGDVIQYQDLNTMQKPHPKNGNQHQVIFSNCRDLKKRTDQLHENIFVKLREAVIYDGTLIHAISCPENMVDQTQGEATFFPNEIVPDKEARVFLFSILQAAPLGEKTSPISVPNILWFPLFLLVSFDILI